MSEVRCQKSDVRSQKSEVRSQKSEVRSQKSEVRSQKSEVRSQMSEVRCQKSEDRSQMSDVRCQMSDFSPWESCRSAGGRLTTKASSRQGHLTALTGLRTVFRFLSSVIYCHGQSWGQPLGGAKDRTLPPRCWVLDAGYWRAGFFLHGQLGEGSAPKCCRGVNFRQLKNAQTALSAQAKLCVKVCFSP